MQIKLFATKIYVSKCKKRKKFFLKKGQMRGNLITKKCEKEKAKPKFFFAHQKKKK